MINQNFNSIINLLKAFPDEQSCINHLKELRWNGNIISPFDPDSKVYSCKDNKYRCKNTGKYFNVRTATLFDNTKVKLQKWFLAIWLVTSHKKGISSMQLAKDIYVTQKTAWFMLQRIRNCFGYDNEADLNNDVEIDETFIGGKNKNRHASKKIGLSQGRSVKDKTPVVGMVERKGELFAKQINDTKTDTLTREIIKRVKQSASIFTDKWLGYNNLSKIYDHSLIKHNANEYVNGQIHTNTIKGFWSLLKRGIVGIYHFTSKKHLQMYVDEFVFRYNTRNFDESTRFNTMLSNTEYRLTYKKIIND